MIHFPEVSVSDFYDKAFYVLLCFAPPWKCIKPLLLAFSEMTKQAVASHLGLWSESEIEPPPYPYSRNPIVDWSINVPSESSKRTGARPTS